MRTVTYPYSWTRETVDVDGERATLLWVCIDCAMTEANGVLYTHAADDHDCEPWSIDQEATRVTPGRLTETVHPSEREAFHDSDLWGESYETQQWSTSRCDGCGCHLAGTRHAYTAWSAAE